MKLKPVSTCLVAMVGLFGQSRIYEEHHWPTDVAASYLPGTAYVIELIALYQRVRARDRGVEW